MGHRPKGLEERGYIGFGIKQKSLYIQAFVLWHANGIKKTFEFLTMIFYQKGK